MAVLLAACGGGGDRAAVPEDWAEASDGDLAFALPPDATPEEPPTDPQASASWRLPGDEPAPVVSTYRNPGRSEGGDQLDVEGYKALVFGLQGGLGGLEDLELGATTSVDVPGAADAGRFTVSFSDPAVDGPIVQDVLVIVTDDELFDLRFGRVGQDAADDDVVAALFASATVR